MLRIPYDHDEFIEFVLSSHRQLTGYMNADDPVRITWSIRIEGRKARFRNLGPKTAERLREQEEHADFLTGETCHAEISGLAFPIASWRELAGQSTEQDYAGDRLHPIMPDVPATLYYQSQHYAANQNRIRFGERKRSVFDFSWTFDAEESKDSFTAGVKIKTNIAFREVQVYFGDPTQLSEAKARDMVTQYCRADDLGESRIFRERWVVFPIRPDVA